MAATPVVRTADGKGYECARKASHTTGENTAGASNTANGAIPDGCIVQGHYNGSTLDGVRVIRLPGNVVVHTCGTQTGLTSKWVGQS